MAAQAKLRHAIMSEMSSAATRLPPATSTEPIFRLSVDQYHAMIEKGVLSEDDPVELLEGMLVFKMPKRPNHPLCVRLLTTTMDRLLPPEWHFRAQEPVTLEDGEPEPDGVVVRGGVRDFATRHPSASDVPLIIEVADTSLARDRGIKLRSYARARIPTYWIVDLVGRKVEVYNDPTSDGSEPRYARPQVYGEDTAVPVILDGINVGEVGVASILA